MHTDKSLHVIRGVFSLNLLPQNALFAYYLVYYLIHHLYKLNTLIIVRYCKYLREMKFGAINCYWDFFFLSVFTQVLVVGK